MKIQNQRTIKFGPFWIGNKYNISKISYALSSYLVLQIYFFIFFFQHFLIESIFNCVSSFLVLFTYFNCVLREPGVIKKVQLSDVANNKLLSDERRQTQIINEYFKERFCQICDTMCPPKTHHCDKCNNCVKHYDNHIDYMGNCIGIRNYKYFIGWVYALVFQYIIWYVVMIQHFLQKSEFLQMFFESIGESYNFLYYNFLAEQEIILIIIIILLLYFLIFYKSGLLVTILKILILIYILVQLLIPFIGDYDYYETIFCSLIFVIVTYSGAIHSLKQFIVNSFNIAIGVNQFEWSVLEKQYNSVDFQTLLKVDLINNSSSNNNDNQINEQNFDRIIEYRNLRENLLREINSNPRLKDIINNEKVLKNIVIERKKFIDKIRFKQTIQNTIIEHENKATFYNYFKNLGKLIVSEIPKSDLD